MQLINAVLVFCANNTVLVRLRIGLIQMKVRRRMSAVTISGFRTLKRVQMAVTLSGFRTLTRVQMAVGLSIPEMIGRFVLLYALLTPNVFLSSGVICDATCMIGIDVVRSLTRSMKLSDAVNLRQVRDVSKFSSIEFHSSK